MQEERQAEPGGFASASFRQHDAVGRGAEQASGEVLQHVSNVDGQVGVGLGGNPITLRIQDLETIGRTALRRVMG